ncbi:hypothetical protein WCD91_10095 [Enterobacter cloacae]|uniref:hypothetical protein n=1 Tax=Enterobacter cloacae TaxID=550 RepID=UPI0034D60BA4
MSSREAFEAWVDSNFPFKKDRFDLFRGEYKSQFTRQLWQSWQASREGLDAKLKSAENNDVDARCHVAELEAKCAALAAENAGLKELIEQHANSVAVCPNCSHEEPSETDDIVALYRSMEIPATDAFLAEVRAQGVEMFAAYCGEENSVFVEAKAYYRSLPDAAYEFASQLRKGVQS